MLFRKYFVKAIKKRFPSDHLPVIRELDQRFEVLSLDTKFAARSGNPLDKRLDFVACFLALIHSRKEVNRMKK